MIRGWWLITDPLEESQGYYYWKKEYEGVKKPSRNNSSRYGPLAPQAVFFQRTSGYKATSFVTFNNVLFSSMVHTSQVGSPSILAVAAAVNPVADTASKVEAVHPGGRVPELLLPNSK